MRSMACWLSPRAIIWVKTRRCWSRKKSSGLRFSMAALRALLSRMMAPRTERSASRLLGRGFSRVESEGMRFRFMFAILSPKVTQNPLIAQDDVAHELATTDFFQVARDYACQRQASWARHVSLCAA